jgi:hypothetical protein
MLLKVYNGPASDELKNDSEFRDMIKTIIKEAKYYRGYLVIESSTDFYHMVVEELSKHIGMLFYEFVDILKLGGHELKSIDPLYESCIGMIDNFNNILSNESKHNEKKRKRTDDDDAKNPKKPRK